MHYLKTNKKTNEIIGFFVNILVTFLILFFVFELWNKDIYVPIAYQNDGIGAVATIKSMIEGHGIWHWPYWSAPYGETYYLVDYILPVCIIRLIIFFVKDVALVTNIFWLMTYFLTALTTYMLLRKLEIRKSVAIFGAVIYNFLPYHFFRIEHFWLCGCYVIPLAIWLILDGLNVITYKKNTISFGKYNIKKNLIVDILFAVIIGLNGIYYAVFTIILMLISSLLFSIYKKKVKIFIRSGFCSVFVFLPIVIFYLLPALIDQGRSLAQTAATRNITDIDRYSLKIFLLFFPIPGHRISALSEFASKYGEQLQINNEGYTVALGIIMSVGFIISVLAVFCNKIFEKNKIIIQLGLINIIILFVSCTGGLANFIGIFLTSAIRCFNRMSVFIALNSVIVICILAEFLFNKYVIKKSLEIILISGLTCIGIFDQTSNYFSEYALFNPEKNEYQWSYEEKEKEYRDLNKFFGEIEELVGSNAIIYQMPQTPYYGNQESPFVKMKAYVCSKSLRWTYSALYTEYIEWQNEIEKKETIDFLNIISLLDMSGIVIDKNGFETSDEFRQWYNEIKEVCKTTAIIDESGSLYFFDISDYKKMFLNKFDKKEIEELQDAIKDEVDGVQINSIKTNRLFTSKSGKNTKDNIHLKAGELQYGPYINLLPGKYRITILGENIANAKVRVTAESGKEDIEVENIIANNNIFTYEFELKKHKEDIEFLVECDENMSIEGYYYEKKCQQQFHDLIDYFKKSKNLKEKLLVKAQSKIVKPNELFVKSAISQNNINNDIIKLKKNEIQFGPYHNLDPGDYSVIVRGKNLTDANVMVTSNSGINEISIKNLKKSSNMISYEISVEQFESDVEFLIENRGDEEIEIVNYEYKQIKDVDIGAIKKYLE